MKTHEASNEFWKEARAMRPRLKVSQAVLPRQLSGLVDTWVLMHLLALTVGSIGQPSTAAGCGLSGVPGG